MPAILIAARSGTPNGLNSNEPLSMTMTSDEASWMGEIEQTLIFRSKNLFSKRIIFLKKKHFANKIYWLFPWTKKNWSFILKGSIAYLILPLCSFSSGFISDFFGRKTILICLNIPFLIGWIILYQATQVWQIFFAVALQTMAVSFVKTILITFCGEIWFENF